MKKIFLILLSAALLGACKKNTSSPKQILLSKVFVDGNIETENIYNSEGQLKEAKYYSDHLGFWEISNLTVYSFDANGKLTESLSYNMPENELSSHSIFTLNGQGSIIRNSIYNTPDSGKLSFHVDHDYNGDGRCIKQIWKGEDEEAFTTRNIGYYPNGNMRTSEVFYQYGVTSEKKWGSSYGPSDTTLPASFYNVKAYPVNYYYSYLTSQYINHYTYDDGAVTTEYKELISARRFNSKGLVTQETITTKHIKPVKPDEVRVLKFEYVEF
jgi:hypothetical protein